MTRKMNSTVTTFGAVLCLSFARANAEPQQMQTMTTVGAPATVQLAQADTMGSGARVNPAPAANTAPRPPASQPAQLPGDQEYVFVVNGVQGKVDLAPIGTDALGGEWKPVRVGDRIRQGYQIRCSFQSGVKLVGVPADPPTVMSIESGTLLAFDEMVVRNNRQRVRLDLGKGAIKAGVAESGDVRSDMEIRTPTATLSKKGTDIFRVEWMNGRFRMSLSSQGRGLLQAIQLRFGSSGNVIGTRSRFVTRGQFVTQEMFKAIDHVRFDRDVNISDYFGQTPNEIQTILNNNGLAFLRAFGDNTAGLFGGPDSQPQGVDTGAMGLTTTRIGSVQRRSEGDFGIGQTVLPAGSFFGNPNRQINGRRQITHRDGVRKPVRRMAAQR